MSENKTKLESVLDLDLSDLFEEYGYKETEVREYQKVPESKNRKIYKRKTTQKERSPSEIAGDMAQKFYDRAEFWRERYSFFIGKPWRTDAETLYLNFIPIIQLVQEIFGDLTKNQREDREFTLKIIKKIKENVNIERD